MENKFKYANVEQVRTYQKKDGSTGYKYMIHQEHYDKENKKYNGWECVTIYSSNKHNVGDVIYYKWDYNEIYQSGRYVEVKLEDRLMEELPL